MMKKAKLLWMDLEMTGLEPGVDKILEVAAIATDMKLEPVATYEAVVKVDAREDGGEILGEECEGKGRADGAEC